MDKKDKQQSRRDFLKKAGYVVPVILTMKAMPAIAGYGSHVTHGNNGIGQEKRGIIDGCPPGLCKQGGDFNDNGGYAPIGQNGAPHSGGNPAH